MTRKTYFILLVLMSVDLWLPVLIVTGPHDGDFQCYVDYAKILSTGQIPVPHIAYPFYVWMMSLIFVWYDSSLLTALFFALLTPLVISWLFSKMLGSWKTRGEAASRLLIIIAITIIGPINLLTFPGHLYRGYFSPTAYHSPSYIALRPMALFLVALLIFFGHAQEKTNRRIVFSALCFLFTILITLTKPNFTMCVVPTAVILLFLPFRYAGFFKNRKLILLSIISGGIVALLWQLSVLKPLTYANRGLENAPAILFQPLVGMQSHWLLPKLFLSIAFPLSIAVLMGRNVLRTPTLILSWLLFLIGISYAYLLAQPGNLLYDDHFVWCGQITLFVLIVFSSIELLRTEESRWTWVPKLFFGLQTFGGLLWYASRFYPFAGW